MASGPSLPVFRGETQGLPHLVHRERGALSAGKRRTTPGTARRREDRFCPSLEFSGIHGFLSPGRGCFVAGHFFQTFEPELARRSDTRLGEILERISFDRRDSPCRRLSGQEREHSGFYLAGLSGLDPGDMVETEDFRALFGGPCPPDL